MTVSRTICLGFLVVISLGTLVLMTPFAGTNGDWASPLIALFTSTSAVCVTGLVVVDTGTYFSTFGQAVIVALIQIGGLGYMTATTFLLLLLGRRLKLKDRIAIQQSMDQAELAGGKSLITSIIAGLKGHRCHQQGPRSPHLRSSRLRYCGRSFPGRPRPDRRIKKAELKKSRPNLVSRCR